MSNNVFAENLIDVWSTEIGLEKSNVVVCDEIYNNVTEKYFNISEDNQYKLSFSLADIFAIPSVPNIIEIDYQLTYQMEPDFVTRFVECKKALGSDIKTFIFEPQSNGEAKFILGDPSGYANKIEFSVNTDFQGFPFTALIFPSDVMKEILVANKNFDSAILKVNKEGLMAIEFMEDDIISSYYIMAASQN